MKDEGKVTNNEMKDEGKVTNNEMKDEGKVTNNETNVETKDEGIYGLKENEWMIRPCDIYYDEYSDCTSIKARFNQYFIFGETIDCSQWKKDYKNCVEWRDYKNEKAFDELLTSERNRRLGRLKAHYENNTWKKRDGPPEDWNKPLPEWMTKGYERSYLNFKKKEMQAGANESSCAIM